MYTKKVFSTDLAFFEAFLSGGETRGDGGMVFPFSDFDALDNIGEASK